jgi:hypothetical protein
MKKFYSSLCLFAAVITFSSAQSINLKKYISPPPAAQVDNPFFGVRQGDFALGDVNGDTLPDIFIIGQDDAFNRVAKLYLNQGNGEYIEGSTANNFSVLIDAFTAFADVDNNGTLDLLTCGTGSPSTAPITLVYLNNGSGIFSAGSTRGLRNVDLGDAEFADVDNDGDLDVALSGEIPLSPFYVSELYLNDGNGNFSLAPNQSFAGLRKSAMAFADVDNDGDLDFAQCGNAVQPPFYRSNVYLNNGSGVFTASSSSFTGVSDGSLRFLDYDNDQDQDLLISGIDFSQNPSTVLYANNGNGSFNPVANSNIIPLKTSGLAVADVDGDNDIDIFHAGADTNGFGQAHLYLNNGGIFTLKSNTNLPIIYEPNAEFSDVDGDNDPDLILVGNMFFNFRGAILSINDGNGNFYEAGGISFEPVYGGTIAKGDVNNDGFEDFWVSGQNKSLTESQQLYLGGGGSITPLASSLPSLRSAEAQFADIDNDNDSDLVVMGQTNANVAVTEVHLNNGSGSFTLSTASGINPFTSGDLALADFDNDGDNDLIITGREFGAQRATRYYTNAGNGVFSAAASVPFPAVRFSFLAVADVDANGSLDVYISGDAASGRQGGLYLNTNGSFSAATSTFTAVSNGAGTFSDIDQDGDVDFIQIGSSASGIVSEVYRNDGTGVFQIDNVNSLPGLFLGAVVCEDLNGDTFPDLILTGENSNTEKVSLVLENDGTGLFVGSGVNLRGLSFTSAIMLDVDGDQNKDYVVSGFNNSGQPVGYVYNNFPCTLQETTDSVVACQRYTWNDSLTFFSSDSTANITYTDSRGCDSTALLFLELTQLDTLLATSGLTLQSNDTAAQYQWLNCGNGFSALVGDTNRSFTATQNGSYAVQLTKNGCVDTSVCVVISGISVGEYPTPKISVYPNPSQGTIFIDFNGLTERAEINLRNSVGQLVPSSVKLTKKGATMQVNQKAGWYNLEIKTPHFVNFYSIALYP